MGPQQTAAAMAQNKQDVTHSQLSHSLFFFDNEMVEVMQTARIYIDPWIRHKACKITTDLCCTAKMKALPPLLLPISTLVNARSFCMCSAPIDGGITPSGAEMAEDPKGRNLSIRQTFSLSLLLTVISLKYEIISSWLVDERGKDILSAA